MAQANYPVSETFSSLENLVCKDETQFF